MRNIIMILLSSVALANETPIRSVTPQEVLSKLDDFCRFQKSGEYHSLQMDKCLQESSPEFKKELKALQSGVKKQITLATQAFQKSNSKSKVKRKDFYKIAENYCSYLTVDTSGANELTSAACLNKDGSIDPLIVQQFSQKLPKAEKESQTSSALVNRKPF